MYLTLATAIAVLGISMRSAAQIPYRAPIASQIVNDTFGTKLTGYTNTWVANNYFQGEFRLDEVVNVQTGSNTALALTKPTGILTGALTSVGSLTSGSTGKLHVITNRTGGAVTFVNEYGSATAANRILTGTGADIAVADKGSIILSYNNNNSRWQVVGGTGGISALTGDVTASGPGSAAATVALVGGKTASAVATSVDATLAATDASTVSTIVKRDASGISSFDKLKIDGSTSGTITLQSGATPTSHSVTLPDTVCSSGQVWQDNGSGVMSCVTPSAGGVNLITNSQAEVNNTGWTCYADAAGTAPVDGDAGSPTITFTQSSSSPLIGTGSFIYTKDASNRQGEGCAFSFSVDTAYRAKVLQIEFDYLVGSGTFAAGTASTDSDVTVWLYDVTNSVLIQPTTYKLYASNTSIATRHVSNFQTSATGATYRLILHSGSTSASAYTLKIDDVQVKPSNYVYGTPITDWTTYTPTSSTWLANVTHTGMWRRVGDSLQAQTKTLASGAVTNASYTISIPSGFTIDTAKVIGGGQQYYTSIPGATASANDSGAGFPLYVAYYSTTEVNVSTMNASSTYAVGAQMSATIPFTWGNTDYITTTFQVPISGWSSSVQMSDQGDTRQIAGTYRRSVDQSISTATETTVVWDTVSYDKASSLNTSTGKFTAPEAGIYEWKFHGAFAAHATGLRYHKIYKNNSTDVYSPALDVRITNGDYVTTASAGDVELAAGDTLEVKVYQSSGGALAFSKDRSYWSVSKKSTSRTLSATETIAARYSSTAGTSIANASGTVIPFAVKDYDTHNAYNTSTGLFTAPAAGLYRVTCKVAYASASFPAGTLLNIGLNKNAVDTSGIGTVNIHATVTTQMHIHGSELLRLNAGDTLGVYLYQDTGGARSLSTDARYSHIIFERVGL